MEEMHRTDIWKGQGASMPSLSLPLSQHLHMFTDLEAPQSLFF